MCRILLWARLWTSRWIVPLSFLFPFCSHRSSLVGLERRDFPSTADMPAWPKRESRMKHPITMVLVLAALAFAASCAHAADAAGCAKPVAAGQGALGLSGALDEKTRIGLGAAVARALSDRR